MHHLGGSAICYMKLAYYLGNQHPVYCLQSPGLEGGEHMDSMEEAASLYIKAIRGIQQRGPYHLGGYSMGGIVAYEMAQQLQDAGEEVALLAMMESSTPAVVKKLEDDNIKTNNLEGCNSDTLTIHSFFDVLMDGTSWEMPVATERLETPEDTFNRLMEEAMRVDVKSFLPWLDSKRCSIDIDQPFPFAGRSGPSGPDSTIFYLVRHPTDRNMACPV